MARFISWSVCILSPGSNQLHSTAFLDLLPPSTLCSPSPFHLLIPTYKLLLSTHGTATFLSPFHANHIQPSQPGSGPTFPVKLSLPLRSQDSPSSEQSLPLCCTSGMFWILVLYCHVCLKCVCLFFWPKLWGPVSIDECPFLCVLITHDI